MTIEVQMTLLGWAVAVVAVVFAWWMTNYWAGR